MSKPNLELICSGYNKHIYNILLCNFIYPDFKIYKCFVKFFRGSQAKGTHQYLVDADEVNRTDNTSKSCELFLTFCESLTRYLYTCIFFKVKRKTYSASLLVQAVSSPFAGESSHTVLFFHNKQNVMGREDLGPTC